MIDGGRDFFARPSPLVPQSLDEPFDPFELSLFACKADRAASLVAARLLTERVVVPAPADGIAALRLDVPFWPAHPGMDAESPGDAPGLWLLAGCAIASERLSAYSGYILAPGPLTKGLLRTPYARRTSSGASLWRPRFAVKASC